MRGQAHGLKPVVLVGQRGLTPSVVASVNDALLTHELIKVKFSDVKEKAAKQALADQLASDAPAAMVGMVGHTAIYYRAHPEPEKRRYHLPSQARSTS